MSTATWKLMLPALKSSIEEQAGEPIKKAFFVHKKGVVTHIDVAVDLESGKTKNSLLTKENTFFTLMQQAAATIEQEHTKVVLAIDFSESLINYQVWNGEKCVESKVF